jgi:hypothetical protein
MNPNLSQLSEYEAAQVRLIAKAIISLEQTEGWKHFVKAAETLAANHVGKHSSFSADKAVEIASKVAYASGIHACLGLIKQQKSILDSLTLKSE